MPCPQCHHDNPEDAKFCGACGARLDAAEIACPACLGLNPPANRFCHACGERLSTGLFPRALPQGGYTPPHLAEKILTSRAAIEGEHKQVTVLFCDITDSTGMAERLGMERMHAVLNQFFELALREVHRYEGTVNQFLGDGFMALFGAPIAHEDHAERAVLAGLGLRRALEDPVAGLEERLSVRMGLNTGPVVVGGIGDNLRMDYTAVGDTTNLAARLLALADPGAILASEATWRLLPGGADAESIGPVSIKGKAEPVEAHLIRGLAARGAAVAGPAPASFEGRAHELGVLRELFARVQGQRGQVAGIAGEPGVGKSRLLLELRRALRDERLTCLKGRCLSYESGIPYQPVVDLLRECCGIEEGEAGEAIAAKVRRTIEALEMNPDSEPFVLRLLEGADAPVDLNASPDAIRARTLESLQQVVWRTSRRSPLVILIDDLHWVDQSSEEFLVSLVEGLGGAAVLLVATHRPGYRPPWLEKSYATQIALQPLSPESSARLVRGLPGGASLGERELQEILERGEGNPFFLEELTRASAEGQAAGEGPGVPGPIQATLLAWIDRLPAEPKRALQASAVLGREFPLGLLQALWDGPGVLEPHLSELRHQEMLDERAGGAEPRYAFRHALMQEVAYDSLLTAHRQGLHGIAAAALRRTEGPPTDELQRALAHHEERAAAPGDPGPEPLTGGGRAG